MSKIEHLLLITADQFRWDCLGTNNTTITFTPHLDELARDGVNFQRCYSPNPTCVPARLALLTGRQPHGITRAADSWGPLDHGTPTLPALLRAQGYATGAFGKMHFLPYANPRTTHGFEWMELHEEGRIIEKERRTAQDLGGEDYADYLDSVGWGGFQRAHGIGNNDVHLAPSPVPAEHYESAWVVDRAIDWHCSTLDKDPGRRTFSWVSFTRPHAPFDPPEPYHKTVDPRNIAFPSGTVADLHSKSPALTAMRDAYGWNSIDSPQHSQLARAYYYGLVRFIDEQIGRLVAYLKKEGLYEKTCIIFTADHGEMLGDFGLFFKSNHLESSCKVPLLVKFANSQEILQPNCENLVGLEDVAPTFLELAEGPLPEILDGRSLLGQAMGTQAARTHYFSHTTTMDAHTFMVRHEHWKYIWSEWSGFEELYDLRADPGELTNIVNHHSALRDNLRTRLSDWLASSGKKELEDLAALQGRDFPRSKIDAYSKQGIRWV